MIFCMMFILSESVHTCCSSCGASTCHHAITIVAHPPTYSDSSLQRPPPRAQGFAPDWLTCTRGDAKRLFSPPTEAPASVLALFEASILTPHRSTCIGPCRVRSVYSHPPQKHLHRSLPSPAPPLPRGSRLDEVIILHRPFALAGVHRCARSPSQSGVAHRGGAPSHSSPAFASAL